MNDVRHSRRRLLFAGFALFAVIVLFVVRLVDIQVVRASELNKESLGKRSSKVTTYGTRGDIVDSSGVVLADSVERYDITAVPKFAAGIKRLAADGKTKVTVSYDELIKELAEATGEKASAIRASLEADPDANFAYVAKSATLAVLRAVQELGISWVSYQSHPARTYPNGAIAGNLVGFLGTDGPQTGLERSEDSCLASSNGEMTYERSEDGVLLPGSSVITKEAQDGGTLKLTIDRDFQWYVQQQIAEQAEATGAEWATAVVVRVSDGHLMAVADYPSVDPNDVNGVGVGSLGSLAFSTPYEPGSTFKAMSAAMLLDAGDITQTTHVLTPNRLLVGGGSIKDVWEHGDIRFTTAGVIMNSSNIGISLLSQRMSLEDRYDYMTKFGVGSKTAVGFLGESGGSLRDPDDWDPITQSAVSFGQGVSATSVQVAAIYQTLGNGGVRMPLTLVEGCVQADGTVTDLPDTEGTKVVSKKAARETVEMMENVVSQGPLSSVLKIDGYRIAAKSGTAQVAKDGGGGYGTDRIVSVAGLIPAEDPEYAVVVTLGKPSTMKTSAAAAPTFKKVMSQIIKTFKIQPSTEDAPDIPLTY